MKRNSTIISASLYVGIIVWLSLTSLHAQQRSVEIVLSPVVQTIDGRPYFIHPVQQGQTLFSLSRAYTVSQELIVQANPQARVVIRYGESIRIPAFAHVVEPRETPFGLSRRYGISLQQLHALNPDVLIDGLRIGMLLYFPVSEHVVLDAQPAHPAPAYPETPSAAERQLPPTIELVEEQMPKQTEKIVPIPIETHSIIQTDSIPYDTIINDRYVWQSAPCIHATTKQTYHVALLIPLFLEEYKPYYTLDSLQYTPDNQLTIRHKSFSFIPYYHGVLLALDSIRDQGYDIRLHVFDVDQEEFKARKAVSSPGFANMDLIIGPFFSSTLTYVANFALHNRITIVSPLLADQQQLLNFPNLFNAAPSLNIQLSQLARHVGKNHSTDNIIFVHNSQAQAMKIINNFKDILNTKLKSETILFQTDTIHLSTGTALSKDTVQRSSVFFRELVYTREGMPGLIRRLDRNKENIIITLIGGEAFLSNYLRELNIHSRNYSITIYGIPDWKDYQSIELDYFQNLNVQIFNPSFQDYSKQHLIDFVSRYRDAFGTEPVSDAFRAVHTAFYFFKALALYGKNFADCMEELNAWVEQDAFYFQRPLDGYSGWENAHFYLISHSDFRLKALPIHP